MNEVPIEMDSELKRGKVEKRIYLVVLMSSQQLLCLLITQLLSKGGQQVAELGRADEPIAILHFVTQVKI